MVLDPNRAAFVTREYRYQRTKDDTVKATYADAEPLVIDTNLASAAATTLAATMLAELKKVAQVHQVTLRGTLSLDDLDGAVPHYIVDAPRFDTDGRTSKLCTFEVDWLMDTTTITVRG